MANILHIQATARGERSYSLRVAEAFLAAYQESHPGDTVRTLDLTNDAIPEFGALASAGKYRILHGEEHTPEEAEAWRAVEATIKDLKSADKLVISTPMWNFGVPYRLKQYIDVVVQPGYTFAFSPEEGYSGLMTGRPAALILARGGEYPDGTDAAAFDHQKPYVELIMGFMGITDVTTIVIEPTLQGGPEAAEQALAAAIKTAREKAKTF